MVNLNVVRFFERVVNNRFLIFFEQKIGAEFSILEHLRKPNSIVGPHLVERYLVIVEPFRHDLLISISNNELNLKKLDQ